MTDGGISRAIDGVLINRNLGFDDVVDTNPHVRQSEVKGMSSFGLQENLDPMIINRYLDPGIMVAFFCYKLIRRR
jgi:hypothetical protein